MNKFTRCALIAGGLVFVTLTAACVPMDEYYTEGTYSAVTPMNDADGNMVGSYYQSTYSVRGYWPTYNRAYTQRTYYYAW